jgi:alpha-amylase
VTAAFNNGSGTWDNNSGSDYSLSGAAVQVKDGQVTAGNPCDSGGSTNTTTVFYSTNKNWNAYNVHYRVGSGAWTAVPGESLSAACSGWVSRTIATNGSTVTAAFNNGSGTWDNNSGSDYSLSGAAVQVKDGQVTAGNPCS